MADEAEITLHNTSRFEFPDVIETKATTNSTNTNTNVLDVKPLTQTSTNNQVLEVKPISQTSSETLELKPVNIDSRQELAVTEPIRTDANSTLDLKPLVIDVCSRTGQASLPPTHVCQPYQHRIGFTVMGVELFGITMSGDAQTIVDDKPKGGPAIAWGPVVEAPRRQFHVDLPAEPPSHHHGDHEGRDDIRFKLSG
jgi:hypothetical protein